MQLSPRFASACLLVAMLAILLAACGGAGGQPAAPTVMPTAAPTGDPARGEQIFTTSDCKACHMVTDQKLVGPGLKGVMDGKGQYGDKLPNGKPLNDKNTAEWIKVGGVGKLGQMPSHPDMTPEQLADLVAYLHTLK
ncbi:MAG: cytochrome c [Chloroflexi bacterium SZAS-1]|nr:cytochrome c [Chloroflexi bacterium SZAS-1]